MLADFYRSKEWEQLRRMLMLQRLDAEGNIICAHCGRPIVKKYDCIGHHLVELTETNYKDTSVSLNPDKIVLVHHIHLLVLLILNMYIHILLHHIFLSCYMYIHFHSILVLLLLFLFFHLLFLLMLM